MVDTENKETVLEDWIRKLKNYKAIAALILFFLIVTGLGAITESFDRLTGLFPKSEKKKPADSLSPEDARLRKLMIGTWKPAVNPPAPGSMEVKDFRFTFLRNGTVNWGGVYIFQENAFPIVMSGKWDIENAEMHYKVTSSNVPLVVKEGFTSGSRIIELTKKKMTFIDLLDGKMKVAFRAE